MGMRRDAIRILLRIAFRNLLASRVRTTIIGLIVLGGAFKERSGGRVMGGSRSTRDSPRVRRDGFSPVPGRRG